mmetsp:Transcript_40032/g.159246  ORF Transcript_40032/g.159246 Transcript_40032/m.159246 type:complete len:132 (+) Transcript_40032:1362-1757(+)
MDQGPILQVQTMLMTRMTCCTYSGLNFVEFWANKEVEDDSEKGDKRGYVFDPRIRKLATSHIVRDESALKQREDCTVHQESPCESIGREYLDQRCPPLVNVAEVVTSSAERKPPQADSSNSKHQERQELAF